MTQTVTRSLRAMSRPARCEELGQPERVERAIDAPEGSDVRHRSIEVRARGSRERVVRAAADGANARMTALAKRRTVSSPTNHRTKTVGKEQ